MSLLFPSRLCPIHVLYFSYCRLESCLWSWLCSWNRGIDREREREKNWALEIGPFLRTFEATYIADDECVPSCDILGLECGDDGCGGSCGTCSSEENRGMLARRCRPWKERTSIWRNMEKERWVDICYPYIYHGIPIYIYVWYIIYVCVCVGVCHKNIGTMQIHAEGRGLAAQDSSLTPMCRGDVGRCVYFVAAATRQPMDQNHVQTCFTIFHRSWGDLYNTYWINSRPQSQWSEFFTVRAGLRSMLDPYPAWIQSDRGYTWGLGQWRQVHDCHESGRGLRHDVTDDRLMTGWYLALAFSGHATSWVQVSTGMGCSDDYCGNVRLIQMNVFVDAATAEHLGAEQWEVDGIREVEDGWGLLRSSKIQGCL